MTRLLDAPVAGDAAGLTGTELTGTEVIAGSRPEPPPGITELYSVAGQRPAGTPARSSDIANSDETGEVLQTAGLQPATEYNSVIPGGGNGRARQRWRKEPARFGRGFPPGARRLVGWRTLPLGLLTALALLVALAAPRAGLLEIAPGRLLLDRHGAFLAEFPARLGDGEPAELGYWPVDALPTRVVAATLALEDRHFWSHPGVDPRAVVRAAGQNLIEGERVSGASTLAMQVVRMQHPAPRTYWNKALEATAALIMTARYGREAVLRQYLRLVPYGNRYRGIAYAARRYLDKPVDDLSWAEIAFLAAIPQSPSRMNPLDYRGRERAVARGLRILDALHNAGVMSAAEFELARAQIRILPITRPAGRPAAAMHAILALEQRLGDGRLSAPADAQALHTTLDLGIQHTVFDLANARIEHWRRRGAGNVAVIVMARDSGAIRAWLGSANYFDDAHAGRIDYTGVARSPGSTLKPLIYALALETNTITAATVLDDLPHGRLPINNADYRYLGPLLPRQALANSRNLPAAALVADLGLHRVYGWLRRLNLVSQPAPAERYGLGLALGSMPVTLESLVAAYGVLASEGRYRPPRWFEHTPAGDGEPLLRPATARQISLFLSDPTARLPSFPRMGPLEYRFPVAVKTGTSQDYRDAWAVAYSTHYVVGVWTGQPDPAPMDRLNGADTAAELVQAILGALHGDQAQGLDALEFPPPEGYVRVGLCGLTGLVATPACPKVLDEWLAPADVPTRVDTAFIQHVVDRRDGRPANDDTPQAERVTRTDIRLPARYAQWLAGDGRQGNWPAALPTDRPVHIEILSPTASEIYRNPETPATANTIALAARVEPPVADIVWYVNGQPFTTSRYPYTARLPLTAGRHRIQAGVALTRERSAPVTITVH